MIREEGLLEAPEEKRGDSFQFSRDGARVLRVPSVRSHEEGGWVPGFAVCIKLVTSKDRFGVNVFSKSGVHVVKLLTGHGVPRPEAVVESKF